MAAKKVPVKRSGSCCGPKYPRACQSGKPSGSAVAKWEKVINDFGYWWFLVVVSGKWWVAWDGAAEAYNGSNAASLGCEKWMWMWMWTGVGMAGPDVIVQSKQIF